MTQKETDNIFSEDCVASLTELGEVLRGIHKRLISEGWTIEDGVFTSPDGVSYNKQSAMQYCEGQKKKRKAELLFKRQPRDD